jgi:hypothetical protein
MYTYRHIWLHAYVCALLRLIGPMLFLSAIYFDFDVSWNMVVQVMWAFSLYLEAVAILPQLVLLQRTRNIDNLTGQYVFLLGYVLLHNPCFNLGSTWYFCVLQFEYILSWFHILMSCLYLFFPMFFIWKADFVCNLIFCILTPLYPTINNWISVNHFSLICCRAYRALYILNWVYRFFTEPHYVHWISMSPFVRAFIDTSL